MSNDKYIVNLLLQKENKTAQTFSGMFPSIYKASNIHGALEVTEYAVFRNPDFEGSIKKHIFPYASYEKISYEPSDLNRAILKSFDRNIHAMKKWLNEQDIHQVGNRWRFEATVLGEKVIFAQGQFEELDELMEEVLQDKEV